MTAFALARQYPHGQRLVPDAANLLTVVLYNLHLVECDDGVMKCDSFSDANGMGREEKLIASGK